GRGARATVNSRVVSGGFVVRPVAKQARKSAQAAAPVADDLGFGAEDFGEVPSSARTRALGAGPGRSSSLLELCDPLFHYICRLNRSARKGGAIFDQSQVKAELKAIFASMKRRASADARLSAQYREVELPLI